MPDLHLFPLPASVVEAPPQARQVQVQVLVAVHEHRLSAGQQDRAGRRGEGERRTGDPRAGRQFQAKQAERDRYRTAGAGQRVRDVEVLAQSSFETSGVRVFERSLVIAEVQPVADRLDGGVLVAPVDPHVAALIRRPRVGADRRGAFDGERSLGLGDRGFGARNHFQISFDAIGETDRDERDCRY